LPESPYKRPTMQFVAPKTRPEQLDGEALQFGCASGWCATATEGCQSSTRLFAPSCWQNAGSPLVRPGYRIPAPRTNCPPSLATPHRACSPQAVCVSSRSVGKPTGAVDPAASMALAPIRPSESKHWGPVQDQACSRPDDGCPLASDRSFRAPMVGRARHTGAYSPRPRLLRAPPGLGWYPSRFSTGDLFCFFARSLEQKLRRGNSLLTVCSCRHWVVCAGQD